jgi:hypothetical protein
LTVTGPGVRIPLSPQKETHNIVVGFSFLKKAKLICVFFRKEKDKILVNNLGFYSCSGFLSRTHEVNLSFSVKTTCNYTNGYESWAIVRDTGYPSTAFIESTNNDIISFAGDLNGAYPQRLQYGTSVYTSNGDNAQLAISNQGPDKMVTKLWFAK